MDKSKLLDRCGAEGEDRLLLAKVLDRAEQAAGRNVPAWTDFLSPQQQMLAQDLLRLAGIPETAWLRQGGYRGAERNILLFLPDWMEPETAESPLRCLRASFRPEDRLSHRDILGSLMGMGIVREKVGEMCIRDRPIRAAPSARRKRRCKAAVRSAGRRLPGVAGVRPRTAVSPICSAPSSLC